MPTRRVFKIFAVLSFCLFMYQTGFCSDSYLNARLLEASSRGDTFIAKESLAKGAFIDTRDRLGNTPLILAADGGYQEIVRLLLSRGAAVNAMNIYGYTPLLSAVTNFNRHIASILVKAGADPDIPNKYGTTASMYITTQGFFTMDEYISGAEPAMSAVTDDRQKRRGSQGGIHNSLWRETFNKLLSEDKSAEAANILVKSAENGHKDAQFLLGSLFLKTGNNEKGIAWLKKAALDADENMLYEIGLLLTDSETLYDVDFGSECLKKSMEMGNPFAKAAYAKLLMDSGDYNQAYVLLESEDGSTSLEAKFYKGYMLFAGKGVARDEAGGLQLINQAATEGYSEAKLFLGSIAFEDFIKSVDSASVSDRYKLRGDIISLGGYNDKSATDGCDMYVINEVFSGAYGVQKVKLCYPGGGVLKATYYMDTVFDDITLNYLKNIAANAEFISQ